MHILLIAQPDRIDHYSYLAQDQTAKYSLLWYEKPSRATVDFNKLPLKFEHIIYWKDYITPSKLLKAIKPSKIIFFEIIDLRQIALIVAAKAAGITTFYLEHGAANDRGTAIERWKEITFVRSKLPYLLKRFCYSFADVLASKLFYYSQFRGFGSVKSRSKYYLLPLKLMLKGSNEALAHCIFRERVPKYSLCFNEVNFEAFQVYTGISREDAVLTGIPFFDSFYSAEPVEKDYIVFIDHPYLEEHILDWTSEFHSKIANALYTFSQNHKIKIFVKLHPKSDKANWLRYGFDPNYIEIIQEGDYTKLYLESKLILGYSSSLMTGFLCARKNIVLLGWHPNPGIFGLNFSETGLCHKSLNVSDLETKYEYWVTLNLSAKTEPYQAFLKRCNYPFDGKATQRVIDAIHNL